MEMLLKLKHYIAFYVKVMEIIQSSFFSTGDMGKQIHMQFIHYPIFKETKMLTAN